MRSSPQLLLCSLILLGLTSISTCSSSNSASSSLRQKQKQQLESEALSVQQQHRQLQQNPATAYALYSLPPFTITFTSSYQHANVGLPSDPIERGQLLSSTLHAPLQMITTEFLLETFRIEIAQSTPLRKPTQLNTTDSNNEEASVQAILDSFMTLDLQVAVRSVDHVRLSGSGSVVTGNDDNNNGRQLEWQASQENQVGQQEGVVEPPQAEPWEQLELEEADPVRTETLERPSSSSTTSSAATDAPFSALPESSATDSTTASITIEPEQPVMLQFEADFFTTAAFLEPTTRNSGRSASARTKPSNEAVAHLMGGWMETAFSEDSDYYKADLQNSEEQILKHLQQLLVQPNSGAVFDPYTLGGGGGGSSGSSTGQSNQEAPTTVSVSAPQQPSAHGNGRWSNSEKLFFTILVMVSVVSIAGLLLAVKRYKTKRDYDMDQLYAGHPGHVDEFSDHQQLSIGGRHADEIMDILNASDRYLATHRPDLLEAMEKHNDSGIIPIATNNDNDGEPVQRRYVTSSNPFSYLYGASYFHKDRQAVETSRRKNADTDPMSQVELDPESVPDDEDLDASRTDDNNGNVSGYLQSWFQNLVRSRSSANHNEQTNNDDNCYAEGDGLIDADMDDLIIEECINNQDEIMACEEDPSDYKFPYQDFPRQDGTPCLIYEETLNEEEEEQYLRNSASMATSSRRRDSLHSTTSYGVHDALTDDEFQRALSNHSSSHIAMDYTQPILGSSSTSFEQQLKDLDDSISSCNGSIVQTASLDDDDATTDSFLSSIHNNDATDCETTNPAQFTHKLEKMVAMRHRHYEKQKIVERHREQRKRERARQRNLEKQKQQEEMQERDRRLRRHSLELDIQELEAAVGSGHVLSPAAGAPLHGGAAPSTASKVITPTDRSTISSGGHQQQASWHQQESDHVRQQLQKPTLHRRTSSEADKGLPAIPTGATVVGIQTNRSMDLHEGSIFDQASQPATRQVQSARKRSSSTSDYNSVFRSDGGMTQPLSSPLPPSGFPAMVSPVSSFTDTGSVMTPGSSSGGSHRSSGLTPPLMVGSGSIRNGSSARKKQREGTSPASKALAKGYQQHRRSLSFGGMEEKKTDDGSARGVIASNNDDHPLPTQHRRSDSMNHRRSNSGSPADVMLHGIYAHFS